MSKLLVGILQPLRTSFWQGIFLAAVLHISGLDISTLKEKSSGIGHGSYVVLRSNRVEWRSLVLGECISVLGCQPGIYVSGSRMTCLRDRAWGPLCKGAYPSLFFA